jgi:CO/xanthine dehydrogenase FAD-binding subunit
MPRFQFFSAKSLGDALGFLSEKEDRGKIIAGGTDLIPRLREKISRPEFILNILEIEGLNGVKESDHVLRIGATTTHSQLGESPILQRTCPSLAQAAVSVGGPLIRNRGTIGGNIANASPAADLASALLALDAEVVLMSEKKTRVIALDDFFTGPGKTVRDSDELLTEILVPFPKGKSVFLKLGRRRAMSLSIVNVAVQIEIEGGKCRDAKIAMGSVAPTPIRCHQAERMLVNKEIGLELISKCAGEAVAVTKPIDDQRAKAWYRMEAGTVLLKRALAEAAGLRDG